MLAFANAYGKDPEYDAEVPDQNYHYINSISTPNPKPENPYIREPKTLNPRS